MTDTSSFDYDPSDDDSDGGYPSDSASGTPPAGVNPQAPGVLTESMSNLNRIAQQSRLSAQRKREMIDNAISSMQASRQDRINLPLLQFAAGMLAPTKTGGFGESLSSGFNQAAPALQAQRAADDKNANDVLGLRLAGEGTEDDLNKSLLNTYGRLSSSALRYGAKGDQPLSPLGKLMADIREHRIDPETGRAMLAKMTQSGGMGINVSTDDQGRITGLQYGQGVNAPGGSNRGAVSVNKDQRDAAGMSDTTKTKLDTALDAGISQLQGITQFSDTTKPEYLTYVEKGKNWLRGQGEKLGMNLPEDAKKDFAAYTTWRSQTFDQLNQQLRAMSGTAVTPQESARLLEVLGNPNDDSPTEFKSKVERIQQQLRLINARMIYLRRSNFNSIKNPNELNDAYAQLNYNNMPSVLSNEASKIEHALRAQGVTDRNELIRRTREEMTKTYGFDPSTLK